MNSIPDWMKLHSDEHVQASMLAHPELWIAAAQFDTLRGINWESRISLVIMANELPKADSVNEWRRYVVESYQTEPDRTLDGDRKARKFYTQSALIRLLELIDAPTEFIADVKEMTQSGLPTMSEKRGSIQAALICEPDLANNPSELARRANCDRKLADRYLKDGSVKQLPLRDTG